MPLSCGVERFPSRTKNLVEGTTDECQFDVRSFVFLFVRWVRRAKISVDLYRYIHVDLRDPSRTRLTQKAVNAVIPSANESTSWTKISLLPGASAAAVSLSHESPQSSSSVIIARRSSLPCVPWLG